jgi:hypothetical protein
LVKSFGIDEAVDLQESTHSMHPDYDTWRTQELSGIGQKVQVFAG